MKAGMLKHLFAVVFLCLAASPFTAPFQTCHETHARLAAPPANDDDDPGSLVGPLITKADLLTAALPGRVVLSYFVQIAFLTPSEFVGWIPGVLIRPTVLRL